MNRSELIITIRDWLNRPNLSDTAIGGLISMAEGELNRALREHPRNIRRVNYTLAAGTSLLPLPTDIAGLIQLMSPKATPWRQYTQQQWQLAEQDSYSFIPRGDCLEIVHPPSVDTTFYLDYNAFLLALAIETDTNWVATYYPDLYLYGALKESTVYLKDDPRLGAWRNEWDRRVAEAQLQGWNQNIGSGTAIRLLEE